MAYHVNLVAAAFVGAMMVEMPATSGTCPTVPISGHVYTLGEILTALENGATLAAVPAADRAQFDSIALALRDAKAENVTVAQMATLIVMPRARFSDVARWDPQPSALLAQKWFRDAVLALPLFANGTVLPKLRSPPQPLPLPRSVLDPVFAPVNQLGSWVRDCATARSAEKLRHIEVKYGPGSPSLNLAEVGLNYVGQWLPFLKPATDGWPSRYEFIAAYRPMELTGTKTSGADARATLISAGQLGIRWYHWDPNWGTGGRIAQLKRPRHASLGAYAVGPQDKPLQKPWESGRRLGVFFGWGEVHAAYVFDAPRRVLIGHGKQLIPYVF